MLYIYNLLQKILSNLYFKEIPISSILSESKKVSIEEGWGGKHIKYFPSYNFFLMYISGKEREAMDNMKQWYFNRFVNNSLYIIPKSQGGMLGGSLFRVVADIHKAEGINLKTDLSNSDNDLIIKGINLKVNDRFSLLKSILKNGYKETGNFVSLKRIDDFYTIVDGHHRVAAVAACGYSTILCATKNNIFLRLLKKISKSSQLAQLNKEIS